MRSSIGRGSALVVALFSALLLGVGAAPAALAATCGTDEFDGTTLDDARWDVLRPVPSGLTVGGGTLGLELGQGDLISGTSTVENLVLQDAPGGGWVATTEFSIAAIDENGEQAGLALWKSEGPPSANNAFAKATFIQVSSGQAGTRRFESIWTDGGGLAVPIPDSQTAPVTVAADADVQLRMRSDGTTVTAEYSLDDGATWTQIGRSARYSGPLRVGLLALRGSAGGGAVPFERFTLACGPDVAVTASAPRGVAPHEVSFTGTTSAGAENLAWDFGDGSTATGGASQLHTFDTPGTYRVSLTADQGGVTTRATARVTVLAADPPCPAASDEFSGNALDPRWELRRPRLTGLDVADGGLRLQPYPGDMHGGTASARNVLLQPAPTGPWTATTRIDTSALTATGDQAGILLWRGEAPNNFAKIVYNRRDADNFWVERQNNVNGVTQPGGGNPGLASAAGGEVFIRVRSDGAANPNLTAEYSIDGTAWTVVAPQGGTPSIQVGGSGPLKLGLAHWGADGLRPAVFDYVRVEGLQPCGSPDTIAPLTVHATSGGDITLTAVDDASGSGVETTEYRIDAAADWTTYTGPFTVSEAGRHTVEYRSTDRAGNVETTKSVEIDNGNAEPVNIFDTIGISLEANKANSQIFGQPSPYSLPAEEMPASRSIVQGGPTDAQDDVPFRMPNTSGTVANLAAFHGQTVFLRPEEQKAYAKIHFFGTTTDGGPAGGDFVLTYGDGSTQTINVQFADWCQTGNPTAEHHVAIGPLTHRWSATSQDGAPCGVFHVPETADPAKTLVSVKLPPTTTPGDPPIQSYLMALTLEEPGGAFVTPDLGASPFPDDLQAPATTAALDPANPQGQNGWYTSAVTVRLQAADETGGSGLERIEYRVDGGAFQPYTAAVAIAGEGNHLFEYRAVDRAGNFEAPKSVPVRIDHSAPATTGRLDPARPGASGWFDDVVRLTLRGRDNAGGSGVRRTEYRIGAGPWRTYTGPVAFAAAGTYAVSYRSVDTAGNAETAGAPIVVRVDAAPPVTRAQLDPARPGAGGVYGGPVRVTLAAGDGAGGSGVGTIEYRVDGGALRPYTGSFTISARGGHRVEYRSRDRAGNLENLRDLVFGIGNPPSEEGGEPEPFAALAPLARRMSLRTLLNRGLRVTATCVSVGRGTLALAVGRRVARRLGLERRTLATRSVRCGSTFKLKARLRPGRGMRKTLRRARGSFTATLRLRMAGVSDSRRITFRGRRGG